MFSNGSELFEQNGYRVSETIVLKYFCKSGKNVFTRSFLSFGIFPFLITQRPKLCIAFNSTDTFLRVLPMGKVLFNLAARDQVGKEDMLFKEDVDDDARRTTEHGHRVIAIAHSKRVVFK